MDTAANGTRLTFRYATAFDTPAVVGLVESAYRGDVSRQGWTTEADLLEGQRTDPAGVAEIIAKPLSRVLLGEVLATGSGHPSTGSGQVGRQLLACCHLEKLGDACYFGMFSVLPTLQGGGIGRLMVSEAERIARAEWKCTQMEMTVISIRDELIAWYERRGYRRTGVYKPFPYGDERFGIPKRDDLRFELLEKAL
jgi:ribosomal protein S18 acetylase RimI-like enzyme